MTDTFAGLGIPGALAEFLDECGFTTPFEVQTATIPDALAGRDVSARAPTGSGKTLAFGLPLLMRVEGAKPRRPLGLVLAPTRELAEQIQRELHPIAHAGGRRIIAVYGGVGYEHQKQALARGVDVLVACPGRLADLIEQGEVDLDEVEFVVIDEADRMADMGFLPEVRRLLDRTPDDRQTLLYSATLDGDVAVLTRHYQRDPAYHEVGDPRPNIEDMRHLFWRLDASRRIEVASDLIQAAGRTIVFCRTRRGADRVARQLNRAGASAAAIHGSRSQNQRTRALQSFSDGRVEALVATDVAARGIHVEGVACVLRRCCPRRRIPGPWRSSGPTGSRVRTDSRNSSIPPGRSTRSASWWCAAATATQTYSRCVYIWVDKDFAMVRGHVQGYPKKLGDIWLTRPGDGSAGPGPRLEPGGRFGGDPAPRAGRRLIEASFDDQLARVRAPAS